MGCFFIDVLDKKTTPGYVNPRQKKVLAKGAIKKA
jgi:hypothetical protein